VEYLVAILLQTSGHFVRAKVAELDTDCPIVMLEHSREYSESMEAETILKILKSIVMTYFPRSLT